ncbi:hypothetical protein NQ318_018781 [Aromia moschata]|uniref:Uncharacterized protein n=1 Tax=Aromia moschata TaxID=1265417 RepID=A0AAV8ZIA7_9CUCU|nr:hypothetical protein NQ318_018781 [Aromia moschata]
MTSKLVLDHTETDIYVPIASLAQREGKHYVSPKDIGPRKLQTGFALMQLTTDGCPSMKLLCLYVIIRVFRIILKFTATSVRKKNVELYLQNSKVTLKLFDRSRISISLLKF